MITNKKHFTDASRIRTMATKITTACGETVTNRTWLVTRVISYVGCKKCLEVVAVSQLSEMESTYSLREVIHDKREYKAIWDILNDFGVVVGRVRLPHGFGYKWEVYHHAFNSAGEHSFNHVVKQHREWSTDFVNVDTKSQGLLWVTENPDRFPTLEEAQLEYDAWVIDLHVSAGVNMEGDT